MKKVITDIQQQEKWDSNPFYRCNRLCVGICFKHFIYLRRNYQCKIENLKSIT